MAWIKMRSALLNHPKIVAMSKLLRADSYFKGWAVPSWEKSGFEMSDSALRCVTCALLMKVWSAARDSGRFVGEDLVLDCITIEDIDQMAEAPSIGRAMQAVGWAKPENGVTLPNFKEYNVPMSPAEKQQAYRQRRSDDQKSVTETLPTSGNKKVTDKIREEERRGDGEENPDRQRPVRSGVVPCAANTGAPVMRAGELNSGPDRTETRLIGTPRPVTNPKAWVDRFVLELCAAFKLTDASRITSQKRAFARVGWNAVRSPEPDLLAHRLHTLAMAKKADASLENPIRAWQAETNKLFPRGAHNGQEDQKRNETRKRF